MAEDACGQELREAFPFPKIEAGTPPWGACPADGATLVEFEARNEAGSTR